MFQDSDPRIVYDDDEIRIIWQPGPSDFVLITFGDLITPAKDLRFFADTPVRKAGIATLGIVAKRGNWYPQANMQAATTAIWETISGYRTRILYGGSMGGYAAIKYSQFLQATHVISLCPQWSLDIAESDGFNPGWQNYMTPGMAGMGIRAADVTGDVFLFVDLYERRDTWHARKIVEAYPGTHIVNVPMVSHHVTTVLAGTDNLVDLIKAVQEHDFSALRTIGRRTRKGHFFRKRTVIEGAIKRFPDFGMRLFVDAMYEDAKYIALNPKRFFAVLDYLARYEGTAVAQQAYEEFYEILDGPVMQLQASAHLARLTHSPVVIATGHGTHILYGSERNACYHAARPASPADLPVRMAVLGRHVAFSVTIGDTVFYLAPAADGTLGIPVAGYEQTNPFAFELQPGAKGKFTIGNAGKYMSADNAGRVFCHRDAAHDWESFRFDVDIRDAAPPRSRSEADVRPLVARG